MKIFLEQLFYGRGARGYAILGASPGAVGFASRVEALCGAVGTPGGDYDGEPFLMSVPCDGRVLMFCVRRGAPDSMGRATLFFHVLVAEKNVLAAAIVDAFSLFEQGAFADKMPQGEIGAVDLRLDAQARQSAVNLRLDAQVQLPAVICSSSSALEIVREVVGDRALDLAWATFAFQPMQGFDIQVLSPRTSCPRKLNEYDVSGKLLRAAAGDERPPDRPPMDGRMRGEAQGWEQPPPRSSAMLKFSLIVNIVLAVLLAAFFALRERVADGKTNPERVVVTNVVEHVVHVPARLSAEEKAAIERAAVRTYRDNLAKAFPQGKRIKVGDERVIPGIAEYMDTNREVKDFIDIMRCYVDFVNKQILEKTNHESIPLSSAHSVNCVQCRFPCRVRGIP